MSESEIPDPDVVSVPMLNIPAFVDKIAEDVEWGESPVSTEWAAEQARTPQCFAYSQTGLRCEQHAGHYGDHSVASTWPDDECFTPGTPVLASLGPAVPAFGGTSMLSDVSASVEPCVICNHGEQFHSPDGCVRRNDEGDNCDCREFV